MNFSRSFLSSLGTNVKFWLRDPSYFQPGGVWRSIVFPDVWTPYPFRGLSHIQQARADPRLPMGKRENSSHLQSTVDPFCWSTTAKSFASPSSTKVRPPSSSRSMKFRAAFGSMKPMRLISVSAQNVLLGIITLNDSHPPLNDRTAASLLTTTDIASINTANSISYADADIFKGRCYV